MAHVHSYWYQFLVPETWVQNLGRVPRAYLAPETWMHVTQMQLCCWRLRFAYTWYIVHAVHRLQINVNCWLVLIDSDWSPWLESYFNAGPVAFLPSKWTDNIEDFTFLVPVAYVRCAQLGRKFPVTSFWYPKLVENLGRVPSTLGWWHTTQVSGTDYFYCTVWSHWTPFCHRTLLDSISRDVGICSIHT